MRGLYEAGVGGITCYMVHGMRSEKPTFLYSTRPFEVHHLPSALKLEVVCSDGRIDEAVRLIGKPRRRHYRGPGRRKDVENPREPISRWHVELTLKS
jgi:nitrogen regulatory protein PII